MVLSKHRNCFPFGDGRGISNMGSAHFQGKRFPDCTKNVIKLFFAMLLYSIYDEHVDDRLPNTDIGEKIRKFFTGKRGKIQKR